MFLPEVFLQEHFFAPKRHYRLISLEPESYSRVFLQEHFSNSCIGIFNAYPSKCSYRNTGRVLHTNSLLCTALLHCN
jgi:hypothetical protein